MLSSILSFLLGMAGGWLGHALKVRPNQLKGLDKALGMKVGSSADAVNNTVSEVLPVVEQDVASTPAKK